MKMIIKMVNWMEKGNFFIYFCALNMKMKVNVKMGKKCKGIKKGKNYIYVGKFKDDVKCGKGRL